ncbi:hypothetical protein KAFR_0D01840 [Kazachstania africana CBS 2517]|uniref:Partial AB-hydrolase lipase domain-containing protein n=1 Tax=Kazachstania africana (strain ATCC 22294 / BCRC 22015 / CBS 2517 / CECT 1963 / NBRC 1671 / NRRL Y-8276) TaxID=1071382 RepID=H2ATY1_KAZAF|nr:hypothetical protein KAFR_0D01840 [Kazachstania africana CBS 2517]CCF57831.1 hypothetical protein KAFR_0D01840 [Kazachstania africana CBS 2517]
MSSPMKYCRYQKYQLKLLIKSIINKFVYIIISFFSMIVVDSFMGLVLLASLYHHYTATALETEPDPRDTRSSKTTVADINDIHIVHDTKKTILKPNRIYSKDELKLVASLNYYYSLYGIQIEEFKIKTKDNYYLDVWHLKHNTTTKNRKPILLIHGLLQSSGSFASSGKDSIAYYLHKQGYDVWLGNNRCGFKYDTWDPKYWDWDIKEMSEIDLLALMDFVNTKNNYSDKLTLIGHSQGTSEIFMALINNNSNIRDKIDNFIALSPACYPGPLITSDSIVMQILSTFIESSTIFGDRIFMEIMMTVRNLVVGQSFFSFICYAIFNYLFDWNDCLWDPNLRDRHFLFSPVYVSVKLMQWWLSNDLNKLTFKNTPELIYPEYESWFNKDPKKHNPNILLFVPKQDRLVDGERLINHFLHYESHINYKIWYIEEYSHLDVLWATDANKRISKPIVDFLKSNEKQ